MSATNNFTVIDLQKVQHGTFFYRNQYGNNARLKPRYSVHGNPFKPSDTAFSVLGETTTLLALAKSTKLLDVWTPVVKFQLTANHNIVYTGKKAVSLWKEWQRKIFKKKKS